MNRTRALIGGLLSAAVLASSACKPPKYVRFISPYKDFTCEVPWGWAVYLDSAGSDYTNATFTGPLDPEFFRGVPSLSVRWYANNAPHRLPDGSYESYASADDFREQMLRDVYGPDAYTKAGSDYDQQLALSKGQSVGDTSRIKVSGAESTHYVVYRTMKAPPGASVGVVQDAQGDSVVRQRHGYVVLPMRAGFYVVTYPATRDGYEKQKAAFFHLANTFRAQKEGPAGPVFAAPPAAPFQR